MISRSVDELERIPIVHVEQKNSCMDLTIAKLYISYALGDKKSLIFSLLSQWSPEYPGGHVQLGCPVVSLTAHVPLFRHGKDVQISAKIAKLYILMDYMDGLVACAVTKTFPLYWMNLYIKDFYWKTSWSSPLRNSEIHANSKF